MVYNFLPMSAGNWPMSLPVSSWFLRTCSRAMNCAIGAPACSRLEAHKFLAVSRFADRPPLCDRTPKAGRRPALRCMERPNCRGATAEISPDTKWLVMWMKTIRPEGTMERPGNYLPPSFPDGWPLAALPATSWLANLRSRSATKLLYMRLCGRPLH